MIVDGEADVVRLDSRVKPVELSPQQAKVVARTIAAVSDDFDAYRFNTAISRMMEFVNYFTSQETRPQAAMESFALLLAPMAPHMAEEIWSLLGHEETLTFEPWPTFDPALLKDAEVEIPVQINGKLRGRVVVAAEADGSLIEIRRVKIPRYRSCSMARRSRRSWWYRASWSISWWDKWVGRVIWSGSTWERPPARRSRTSTRIGRERPIG